MVWKKKENRKNKNKTKKPIYFLKTHKNWNKQKKLKPNQKKNNENGEKNQTKKINKTWEQK